MTCACRRRANGHCSPMPPSSRGAERLRVDADDDDVLRRALRAADGEPRVDRLELEPVDRARGVQARARPPIAASVATVSRIEPAAAARRDTQPRRRHARPPAAARHRRGGVLSLTRGVQVRYSRTPFSVSPLLSAG